MYACLCQHPWISVPRGLSLSLRLFLFSISIDFRLNFYKYRVIKNNLFEKSVRKFSYSISKFGFSPGCPENVGSFTGLISYFHSKSLSMDVFFFVCNYGCGPRILSC
jgi:hypothetical protein